MPQKITNKIMLITYADCMGNNLKDLAHVLDRYLDGAVGGLHILPFFPSSADRGFAPLTYKEVDPQFGTWDDIALLGKKYYLMYDYMINHLSSASAVYKDFLAKKETSRYRDFFIRWKDFWTNGEPTAEDFDKLYKRKKIPYIEAEFADGSKEKLWTTFSDHQIDINQYSEEAKNFLKDNLTFLSEHGASIVRLDAVAYASKREGTNCFFVEPEIWQLLDGCNEILFPRGVAVLPEIHEQYFMQKKVEAHGYYTYDFQLPMLTLNALYFGSSLYLKNWLLVCPRKQFTTLDTHDGIGVVDARYLMSDEDLLATRRKCFETNPGTYELYEKFGVYMDLDRFDTYQINCTYYSACGNDDKKYFIARALQFFAPGIPQVYYVGLWGGKNDFELCNKTGVHRDINRHYYPLSEIDSVSASPLAKKILALMRFRNTHPAFDGEFHLLPSDEHSLRILRKNGAEYAYLFVDFTSFSCDIAYSEDGGGRHFPCSF